MSPVIFAQIDWDWFFSSLAQSAAAIVAIFAGFIINKILANQAGHQAAVDEMAKLCTVAEHLRDEALALPFGSYSGRKNETALRQAADLLARGDDSPGTPWTVDSLMTRVSMSVFCNEEANRQRVTELFASFHSMSPEEKAKERDRGTFIELPSHSSYKAFGPRPIIAGIQPWRYDDTAWEKERDEHDKIERVRRDIRHHTRVIADFTATVGRTDVNRRSIAWWLFLVVVFFFVGVIYPLSFMPSPSPPALAYSGAALWPPDWSLRGWLLVAVSLAFLAVIFVFARINWRTRHSEDNRARLREFMHMGAYAKELGHAEERASRRA